MTGADHRLVPVRFAGGIIRAGSEFVPDLSYLSKAMANGYPIATALGRAHLRCAAEKVFLTFRDGRNLYHNQHFAAECVRRGVFLHPHHNWFISAALTSCDVERILEVADAAFECVARSPEGDSLEATG